MDLNHYARHEHDNIFRKLTKIIGQNRNRFENCTHSLIGNCLI